MKQVTFSVTDALMSPVSFAMLSGAGIIDYDGSESHKMTVHKVIDAIIDTTDGKKVDLSEGLDSTETIVADADYQIYGVIMDAYGHIVDYVNWQEFELDTTKKFVKVDNNVINLAAATAYKGYSIRIDCYVEVTNPAQELQIDAENFAGYYYIEADTLFRDEGTGKDFPANFIIPRGKIQSNFTFTLASSGDPSTFDFTIDAFPAKIRGSQKKTLFTLQIIDNVTGENAHTEKATVDTNASTFSIKGNASA